MLRALRDGESHPLPIFTANPHLPLSFTAQDGLRIQKTSKKHRQKAAANDIVVEALPSSCTACGIGFPSQSHLNKHETSSIHKENIARQAGEEQTQEIPEEENYYCEICRATFTQKGSLKTHKGSAKHKRRAAQQGITVAETSASSCLPCRVSFTQKGSLAILEASKSHKRTVGVGIEEQKGGFHCLPCRAFSHRRKS